MMRTVFMYLFQILYLIRHASTGRKLKKLAKDLPIEERNRLVFEQPQKWAKTTLKLAGAKVTMNGNEKIPEGPVLMVANHQGNFDIMALLAYLEKPFGFISKIEVKSIPVVRSWMETMNCVFIDRKNKKQAFEAVSKGVEKLQEGSSLLIFPEGTRNMGEGLKGFKSGGMRMATHANVPIVPIAIEGTYKVMEANNGKIKPAQIHIEVCESIMPADYEGMHMNEVADLARKRIEEKLVRIGGSIKELPRKSTEEKPDA